MFSPYHNLASKNDFDYILKCVNSKIININIVDNKGNSFLHYSLLNKNVNISLILIKMNINLNIINNYGDTALHIACFNLLLLLKEKNLGIFNYFELIILMINKGAFKYNLNVNLKAPFDYLTILKNIKNESGNSLLQIMINKRKLDIAEFLINQLNFDLNIKNNNGETPLHSAVFNALKYFDETEHFDFLNYLYKVGYDGNIRDNKNLRAEDYLMKAFV